MPKKNPIKTPRGQVKAVLQNLFLKSRERSYALKQDGRTCQRCEKKASQARGRVVKIQVHHIDPVKWKELIDMVYDRLLVHPSELITVCKSCHEKIHDKEAAPMDKKL